MTHFTQLGATFYSKNGVGKLLSYVMNDVTVIRESISMGINQIVNSVILIAAVVVTMLFSSIPLYVILDLHRAFITHSRIIREVSACH